MTGPEHYKAAERLLQHSKNHTDQGNGADDKIGELAAAQAQVHATLALAAATIDGACTRTFTAGMDPVDTYAQDDEQWRAVLS